MIPIEQQSEKTKVEAKKVFLACPLCHSKKLRPFSARQKMSFLRCRGCGLIFLNPSRPVYEDKTYYERSYYEALAGRNSSILQARSSVYSGFLSDIALFRKTNRLLDIGSGYGDFLHLAQQQGWQVWGIDPSRNACDHARKILGDRVRQETVEEADFPEGCFDVITLWNVLDCFTDPVPTLKKIVSWLSQDGVVIIRTPNGFFNYWVYRIFSLLKPFSVWMGLRNDPSVFHKFNFTSASIEALLRKAGISRFVMENAKPTPGDPYRIFAAEPLMCFLKAAIYGAAKFVQSISGSRVLLGSTLVIKASKGILFGQRLKKSLQARIFMKRLFLTVMAVTGYLIGLPIWIKLLGKERTMAILLYHGVSPYLSSDLDVFPAAFEKQMDFLLKRYEILPLREALERMQRPQISKRPVAAVTFDDGYQNNYQVAFPILQKKKIPATIFLLSGNEGTARKASHLQAYSELEGELLRWDEVRKMAYEGIDFGSHGVTHVALSSLNAEAQALEFQRSKEIIEREIQRPVRFFSYPYGTVLDFGSRQKELAKEHGYEAAFSAVYGFNDSRADRFSLKRIEIGVSDTMFTFRAKLNGALAFLELLQWPWVRAFIRKMDSWFIKSRPKAFENRQRSPILLVSVDFPPHTDGVSTISGELSQRIAVRGRPVDVIGPSDRGDIAYDADKAYRIYRFPGYAWGYLRGLSVLLAMPWIVFTRKVRKVFAMNIAYGGILAWLLSWIRPLDYLLFAYGYEFEKVKGLPWVKAFYLKIYQRAKGIIACSEEVKKRLIDFGVSSQKIHVLYPGVDCNRYKPCQVTPQFLAKYGLQNKKIILTVGRIIQRKGHEQVIRALPEIVHRFPDVVYCIAGIGPYRTALECEIRKLGASAAVRFLGKVPAEDLAPLYNACDVFVMPSCERTDNGHIEGFGIVFLEANACAKPVIGGRSGGVIEAIRDGETGFLVEPGASHEIAEKVLFLFSNPVKAKKMGEQGLAWVRNSFDWDSYAQKACRLLMGESLA